MYKKFPAMFVQVRSPLDDDADDAAAAAAKSDAEKEKQALIDRGDVVDDKLVKDKDVKGEPTDEEKKVAQELKDKEAAKAAKATKGDDDDDDEDDGKDKDGKRKDTRIPIARHKALLEAERAERDKLEAKLAQYERGADVAKTNEEMKKAEDSLVKLEEEYATLITDGKAGEAAKKMAEIRKVERTISETSSDLKAAAAGSRAYERARYDVTVERVEAAYPELNEDDKENYDAEKVRKVLRIAKAYQMDGIPPAKALQDAVKDLLGDPVTAKQKEAVDTKARVDDAAAKKAARDEEARNKAADAASKQPPNKDKAGSDSDKHGGSLKAEDVMKMSQSEFAKLDEKVLSRMRGDEI